MMKCEFEQMIGKEVTVETFEMYEQMYLALPEGVSKQQFVEMLNVRAIPESPEAIARKEERAKFVAKVKAQIADLETEYELESSDWERTMYPTYSKRRRKEILAEIKQLRSILRG